ncbi:MAG: CHAD domain-containing protein, partial [Alphaproteobacteria bacterium]
MTEPEPDDETPSGAVTPSMTVADAAGVVVQSCLSELIRAAKTFHRGQTPDHLHQTRVGLRRLRTAMKIFRPAIARQTWIHTLAELEWLAGELNDARDLDVFVEDTFRPARADLSARKPAALYAAKIKTARAAAYIR